MTNMNPLDEFEFDQKMIKELKDLFEFAPPAILRRNLEDLFFTYLTNNDELSLPDNKQLFKNIYFLINFLNEIEGLKKS